MEKYIYKDLRSEISKRGGTYLAGTETIHIIKKWNKTKTIDSKTFLATEMLVSEFLQKVIVRYQCENETFISSFPIKDFSLDIL